MEAKGNTRPPMGLSSSIFLLVDRSIKSFMASKVIYRNILIKGARGISLWQ